jgi:hypothetical protein
MLTQLCLTVTILAAAADTDTPLICCGAGEVFILPHSQLNADNPAPIWSWRATDSPTIPVDARKWFGSTDECKPLKESILITSSGGGVALVQRRDKKCLFHAYARNAHSACILPNNRIAVAASYGGDEVQIYDLDDTSRPAQPIARLPLHGAHGVVWDAQRTRLWALGDNVLLRISIPDAAGKGKLRIDQSWKLPSQGGHDLSPINDGEHLFVTTNKHVYRFSRMDGTFVPDTELGDRPKVKSVTQHPTTGEIVFHQGTPDHFWSETIRFVGERKSVQLPNRRLYKVRWDALAP